MMRVDNRTLKRRVAEIEADLIAEGLSALVIYANGSALGNTSKMHGYMRYLVNYDGHNTVSMLVLRPGQEPAIVSGTNPFNLRLLLKELLWFKDVRYAKAPEIGGKTVEILTEGGQRIKRAGYIGLSETPVPVWRAIEQGMPDTEWVDFAPSFDKHRVQKDELQLTFHRRAAELCDVVFQTVQRDVRKGHKGYELQAEMEKTARAAGAEYCITWFTAMPKADYSRFYKEECVRVPQEGDQVLPGIYLTFDGHWGHAIRTGTFGKAKDEHRKIYNIVREMEEACLAKLKLGEDLRAAVNAMDDTLHKYYKEAEVDRARPGHGLGYSYEDPLVSGAFYHPWEFKNRPAAGTNSIEIKPGMLMELHPNVFIPGVAGAMLGDMVAVTDTGYEILTDYPRDLIEY